MIARYWCTHCRIELERDQTTCPACGGQDRNIEATEEDALPVYTGFKGQARHGQPGEVRWHSEQRSEIRWNHDRRRMERRVEVFDRENNYYLQEWRHLETGEVTFRKEGPLDDPRLHGESARRGGRGRGDHSH